MIAGVIVACEIAFWVLIVAGLILRYPLHRPRTGAVVLLLTPLVDILLLVVVGVDLHRGADASLAHAVAALYLGFSVAYGHAMIRWADARFAHRYAGAALPAKRFGAAYARACWTDVLRTLVATGVGAGVLWLLQSVAAETSDTVALEQMYRILGLILVVEVLWAIGYTLWPRREQP